MTEYAKKTCYDCGIRKPAPHMERVTESYTSGRSDNKVTAGNLAWAAVSDTAAKKVKKTIVANNRRSYTRNRTVWKCMDCSGTNDHHRNIVNKHINVAAKAIFSAKRGGLFSAPKNLPSSVQDKMDALQQLDGTTSSQTAKDLFSEIKALIKNAPDVVDREKEAKVAKKREEKAQRDAEFHAKCDAKIAEYAAKSAATEAKYAENMNAAKAAVADNKALSVTKNITLSVFTFLGYFLIGIAALGAVLEATSGNLVESGIGAIILAAVGYGIVRLCKKFRS
jgi:hypothetical protein